MVIHLSFLLVMDTFTNCIPVSKWSIIFIVLPDLIADHVQLGISIFIKLRMPCNNMEAVIMISQEIEMIAHLFYTVMRAVTVNNSLNCNDIRGTETSGFFLHCHADMLLTNFHCNAELVKVFPRLL